MYLNRMRLSRPHSCLQGTFCPPSGVLLLQKEEMRETCKAKLIERVFGTPVEARENWLTLVG